MGPVIAEGYLESLELDEICAWICMFLGKHQLDDRALAIEGSDLPVPSHALTIACDYSDKLAASLEVELDRTMGLLVLDWMRNKDLMRVARFIDAALLGDFIKTVMRLLSYVEHIREAFLGLGAYESFNRCDNYSDKLLGGLVSNESLYLHMEAVDERRNTDNAEPAEQLASVAGGETSDIDASEWQLLSSDNIDKSEESIHV
eukprot:TRINITY_DN23394_c0_g1_i2.p1 TRINITY_DN23394_c0_g1~~TRINITY_DN23394_c0_g1_i2.p1  ORF type:complete len:203 (+),score=27.50 TRINITY_DN23394_c0_g1_i2:255-863(+)